MSPLGIEILMHYYTRATDYTEGGTVAPGLIQDFVCNGLLLPDVGEPKYAISEKGIYYINALCSLPLPESRFVIPNTSFEVVED